MKIKIQTSETQQNRSLKREVYSVTHAYQSKQEIFQMCNLTLYSKEQE